MKKIFSLFLCVCVLSVSTPVPAHAADSGTAGGNITWTLENKILTISGTGDIEDYSLVTERPWNEALNFADTVKINEGVTGIGKNAFSYANYKSVTIPSSVKSIGDNAFCFCIKLTNIVIPNGVTSISSAAFDFCGGLLSVTIPDSVTSIGSKAFRDCLNLKDVYYSGSQEKWGHIKIDDGNDALKGAAIHYNATVAEPQQPQMNETSGTEPQQSQTNGPSGTCGANAVWKLENGVLTISGKGDIDDYGLLYAGSDSIAPWSTYDDEITSVVIKDGITSIGNAAFHALENLTSATIPDSVTKIGSNSFQWCRNLDNIVIPSSVTSIGGLAFQDCDSLSSIIIPSGVSSIDYETFLGCDNLESITLPVSVTSIGDAAFSSCSKLSTVNYSGTEADRKKIKVEIFAGNDALEKAKWVYNYKLPEPAAPAETPADNIAYASTQSVNVDGKAVSFQMYALKDANGNPTNYIKIRDLASVLNGTKAQFGVGYDGAVNLVPGEAYTPNGTEMSTPFSGDREYTKPKSPTKVNGIASELDAILLIDDAGGGFTYYKLRDLGQALGFSVDWSKEKGVFIETDKPYK